MIYEMGKPVEVTTRVIAPHSSVAVDAAALLDQIRAQHHLISDAQLAKVLRVSCATIHRIRHGTMPVSDRMLIRLHEITGLKIPALRKLLDKKFLKGSNDAKK